MSYNARLAELCRAEERRQSGAVRRMVEPRPVARAMSEAELETALFDILGEPGRKVDAMRESLDRRDAALDREILDGDPEVQGWNWIPTGESGRLIY